VYFVIPLILLFWIFVVLSFYNVLVPQQIIENVQTSIKIFARNHENINSIEEESGNSISSYVSVTIAGSASSSLLSQIIRFVTNFNGISSNGTAIITISFLITFLMASQQLLNLIFSPVICIDAFGLITPLLQWFEWMISVPLMIYMSLTLDPFKVELSLEDLIILILTEMSIFVSFMTTWGIGINYSIICIAVGTVSMICSLHMLVLQSYRTHALAVLDSTTSVSNNGKLSMGSNMIETQVSQNKLQSTTVESIYVKLASRKLYSSVYLCAVLPLFPVVFYAGWTDVLQKMDVFAIVIVMNFLAKHCFALVLTDFQLEMMDPNKLALKMEKAANESRRAFLRYVFHEVRVPLNSISMGLYVLKSFTFTNETSETLGMMQEATHLMAETLNDVLSIQKIEEDKLDLVYDVCDVDNITQNASKSLHAQIRSKGVHLQIVRKVNTPNTIIADKFRLEHVLTNMISNAVKFCSKGGVVKIVISRIGYKHLTSTIERENRCDNTNKQSSAINWSIFDDGIGIKKEEQANVFDIYVRIKPGSLQSIRGSGVGLAICKEIISKHKGSIGVRSDPKSQRGSEFYFNVPIVDSSYISDGKIIKVNEMNNYDDSVSRVSEKRDKVLGNETKITKVNIPLDINTINQKEKFDKKVDYINDHDQSNLDNEFDKNRIHFNKEIDMNTSTTTLLQKDYNNDSEKISDTFKLNILVVDDVASNRKLLDMLLKRYEGIYVETACCGQDAINTISSKPNYFDIIFMDNIMPDMSGLEVSKVLRNNCLYTNLLIGVTGNVMDDDLHEFIVAGADAAYPKPMKIKIIERILNHCRHFGSSSSTAQHGL
jgi:signal transduction histidine kinase